MMQVAGEKAALARPPQLGGTGVTKRANRHGWILTRVGTDVKR